MGLIQGDPREADHINGDRLDNTRANLRICTLAENRRNCSKRRATTSSRFKGVDLMKTGKYRARVGAMHVGVFASEREAAVAYNRVAAKMFGQFAKLNPLP